MWKFSQAACMCYGLYSYFPLDDFLCFLQLECKLHRVQVVVLVSDNSKKPRTVPDTKYSVGYFFNSMMN